MTHPSLWRRPPNSLGTGSSFKRSRSYRANADLKANEGSACRRTVSLTSCRAAFDRSDVDALKQQHHAQDHSRTIEGPVLTGAAMLRRSVWRDGEFGAGNQRRLIREDPDHACVPPKLRWAIWIVYGHACCGVAHCHDRGRKRAHPYRGSRLRSRRRHEKGLRATPRWLLVTQPTRRGV
jgi:hypothetical protein